MSTQSLTIRNNQGWQIHAQHTPETISLRVNDPWGDIPRIPITFLIARTQDSLNVDVGSLLAKEITQLSEQKNRFGFQTYKKEDRIFIVFGPSGLAGGGKLEGVAGGLALATAGTALTWTGIGIIPGTMLIGSGIACTLYSSYSAEDEISGDQYLKNAVVGLGCGLVSNTITALQPTSDPITDSLISNGVAGAIYFALTVEKE